MSDSPKKGGRNGRGRRGQDFLIAGLGASAGGIKALEAFFEKMPPTGGIAYVVILHLSPEHESRLAELLQRVTPMPVKTVVREVKVEPNHVYVIPPAKQLVMEDGHLRLIEPGGGGPRAPIDTFFRTLGETYREHAIGVVLSGTGTDGTLGLRRIKEEGGVSIAQEPRDAEYDGMPRSAIGEGLVDFVLPVAQIPEKLLAIREASERIRLPPEGDEPPAGAELEALRDILSMVRVRTGHDFSNYKQSTILRRVTRRMQMHNVPDLASYREYLRGRPKELPELQQDFLISVTNFFRDAAAFRYLEREVAPKIFEGKGDGDQVRVWVTGCATGEEAYSLAMLLAEQAARVRAAPGLQVFATDLDDEAISQARDGLYPETISADVSDARLREFFTREGAYYRVKKHLREMVLFAPHNILRDPPFTRLDLVSCRNLLIYLNRETQDRVLEIFHFGLRPGGFLFLGSAESAESLPELFTAADKKLRVYRRTAVASVLQHIPAMPLPGRWAPRVMPSGLRPAASSKSYSYPELHRALLEHYAPPSVLVTESLDIVHISESAGKYLKVGGGELSRNLLMLIHPGLRIDLRSALLAAQQEGREGRTSRVAVQLDGESRQLSIIVRPFTRPDLHATFLLVIFDEEEEPAEPTPAGSDAAAAARAGEQFQIITQLEFELQQTRSVLRTTVEQYETTVEELRASNEELQAMNEELRSASEELETSKEELQSLNEELHTVNAELKDKVDEVTRVNADFSNLFAATEIGIVFLDRELRITRYTPTFAELFNVLPSDVGRPLAHLTHQLDYQDLPREAETVLRKLTHAERTVRTHDGRWYVARMMPYRTEDDRVAGVVVTFSDITERRKAEEHRRFLASVVESSQDAIIAADFEGVITSWNGAAERLYGYPAAEALGRPLSLLSLSGELQEVVRQFERIKRGEAVEVYDTIRVHKDGRPLNLEVRLSPVRDAAGSLIGVSTIARDITDRKLVEAALREGEERERLLLESVTDYAIFTQDTEGRITRWNRGAERTFGFTEEEALGQHAAIIFTPEDRERGAHLQEMRQARTEGHAEDERWHVRRDGSRFYASGVLTPILTDGQLVGYVKVARDLTAQQLSEEQRAALAAQLEEERASLERRVEERTGALLLEVAERRTAEGRIRELVTRIVETQEQERRRISRDLHDMLGQQLTALRLNLEAIRESCAEMDASVHVQVEQARAAAERLDAEVDFLAWELRPAALDELGLAAALENFVHEWSEHFQIKADFHTAGLGKRRLAPEIETNLYRVVQEALNNVVKHAGATRVGVILERRDKDVALIVEDDGRGFDPAVPAAGDAGMGLLNMRERAGIIGGTLEIESAPGEGTTVFARVPARYAERR